MKKYFPLLTTFVITILYSHNLIVAQNAVALQGLRMNTLVAGKSTAFRFYINPAALNELNRIETVIIRPDGSQITKSWTRSNIVEVPNSTLGASIVVRVPGKDLPWVGNYQLKAKITNQSGAILLSYVIDPFVLLPTKDLIVAIDRVNADNVNPGTPAEIQAARDAIERLAGIWPIRDGVSTPNGDLNAGLRYIVNNKPQPYGCNGNPGVSDCQLCPFFASWSKSSRPPNSDIMNLGIGFRFQDRGESVGGIAPNTCPNGQLWASIVMSGALAPGFGQECGHVFGLEPTNDPHFDVTVQKGHSKDRTIDVLDAEAGFDVQTNRPFPNPTFDVMYQVVCGCPNDEVSYNSWDWEYLRKKFISFSSTGPIKPAHFMTNAAPCIAGVGKSVYFFGKRIDGRIFYNRALLGQAGQGWVEMEGNGHTDVSPAAAAIGTHVFVAIKGLDGRIYINQADEGKSFGQWFPQQFKTDVAPALVAVGNSIFLFAKGLDQRIYLSQAELGKKFSGWFEVQGNGRTDAAPAAGAVGNHVYVAIKGLDGNISLNQADFGKSFGQWFPMNFKTNVAPAITGVGNNIYFLAKSIDQRIFFNRAVIGQGGVGWSEIQGGGRTNAAPAGGAVGTHLFVGIKGNDNRLLINQADVAKPFGLWLY